MINYNYYQCSQSEKLLIDDLFFQKRENMVKNVDMVEVYEFYPKVVSGMIESFSYLNRLYQEFSFDSIEFEHQYQIYKQNLAKLLVLSEGYPYSLPDS